jgi:hypothetical protein
MDVYLFADINGYLIKVGQFKYEYVEIPLEVGVAIEYGIVFITQKFKQFHWRIESYLLENGSLIKNSTFTTSRIGKLTNETSKNFYNLRNTERFLITQTGKNDF